LRDAAARHAAEHSAGRGQVAAGVRLAATVGYCSTVAVHELERLTAPELSRLIAGGVSRVVVPFGSIEHQGGHLPLGADAVLADAVGREVARRLGAVLAPTMRVGCAEQHMPLMGTITLRSQTLTDAAVAMAGSLAHHGFRVIVLLSTHGGNAAALRAAAARLDASLEGAIVRAPQGDVGPRPGAHSGEWLTSIMLAIRPDMVHLANASGDLADELQSADAQRGVDHLERFVASIVSDVRSATASQ
jgi:creatinine amidohydrolase